MRNRVLALLTAGVILCAPVLMAQAPSGTKAFDPKSVDPQTAIKAAAEAAKAAAAAAANWTAPRTARSEERRVGKECRCRWSRYHYKQKSRGTRAGDGRLDVKCVIC